MSMSGDSYVDLESTEKQPQEARAPQHNKRRIGYAVCLGCALVGVALLVVFNTAPTADVRPSTVMNMKAQVMTATETFNPTPGNLHPTSAPVEEKMSKKASKKSSETYNPTPGS